MSQFTEILTRPQNAAAEKQIRLRTLFFLIKLSTHLKYSLFKKRKEVKAKCNVSIRKTWLLILTPPSQRAAQVTPYNHDAIKDIMKDVTGGFMESEDCFSCTRLFYLNSVTVIIFLAVEFNL